MLCQLQEVSTASFSIKLQRCRLPIPQLAWNLLVWVNPSIDFNHFELAEWGAFKVALAYFQIKAWAQSSFHFWFSPPTPYFFPLLSFPCFLFFSGTTAASPAVTIKTITEPHAVSWETAPLSHPNAPSPTDFNRTSCGLECYTTCAKACRLVYKQAPKNNTTVKKISQEGARNPENHPGNAARVGIRGVLWPEEELQ